VNQATGRLINKFNFSNSQPPTAGRYLATVMPIRDRAKETLPLLKTGHFLVMV
jgi:hypothetical protein